MAPRTLLERISIDPGICSGRACIKGHRVWVSLVLDRLAGGESVEELLAEDPGVVRTLPRSLLERWRRYQEARDAGF